MSTSSQKYHSCFPMDLPFREFKKFELSSFSGNLIFQGMEFFGKSSFSPTLIFKFPGFNNQVFRAINFHDESRFSVIRSNPVLNEIEIFDESSFSGIQDFREIVYFREIKFSDKPSFPGYNRSKPKHEFVF